MGISIDQYRASIGNWCCNQNQELPSYAPSGRDQVNWGCARDTVIKYSWKACTMLLCLAIIGTTQTHLPSEPASTLPVARGSCGFAGITDLCKEQYCINITDTPLISCALCGQGTHDQCISTFLHLTELERQSFTTADAWSRINPTKLPGLHYLCMECTDNTIPSEEAGKLKRKTKSTMMDDAEAATTQLQDRGVLQLLDVDEQENLLESSPRTSDIQPSPDQDNHEPISLNGDNDVSRTQNGDRDRAPLPDTRANICSFYRKGTCRYGISGRGCSKAHPKPCRKLLQHGIKAPHGCTLGRNCDKFHPRLCASSLRKGVCLKQSCRQWHIAGTNRTPPETDRTLHQDGNVNPQTTETSGFLDALRLLKAEILEAMDLKLALMSSGQPAPAQQNMFHQNACDQAGNTATAQMITAPVHWMPTAPAAIHNVAAGIPAGQQIQRPYGQDSVVPPYMHPMYKAVGMTSSHSGAQQPIYAAMGPRTHH